VACLASNGDLVSGERHYIDKVGDVAVLQCEGRIVRSEAAFQAARGGYIATRRPCRVYRSLGGKRPRKWWTRHAHFLTALGSRPQYSTQLIQSIAISLSQAGTCQLDVRVGNCHCRRDDGSPDAYRASIRAGQTDGSKRRLSTASSVGFRYKRSEPGGVVCCRPVGAGFRGTGLSTPWEVQTVIADLSLIHGGRGVPNARSM
jgi:hypothetical protein